MMRWPAWNTPSGKVTRRSKSQCGVNLSREPYGGIPLRVPWSEWSFANLQKSQRVKPDPVGFSGSSSETEQAAFLILQCCKPESTGTDPTGTLTLLISEHEIILLDIGSRDEVYR
jgi:hypothetical protein